MNIIGERVILRAIEENDLPYLKEMMNNPENEKFVVGWSKPVSTFSQEQWFKSLNMDKETIRFAIQVNEQFAGTCILSKLDWKNRTAGINIKILEQFKNNGYGKECIKLLKKYCFEELNLNRIEASILDYNIASRTLFEKCGFKIEGEKRDAIYKNSEYHNLRIYSILRKEYNKIEE